MSLSPISSKHENVSASKTDQSPQSWRARFVAASVIILLATLVWSLLSPLYREPVYRGKTLTFWLQTYAPSSSSGRHSREWDEADEAVRHIGTNSFSILFHMLRKKDSNLKLRLIALVQRQRVIRLHCLAAADRNIAAARAFIVLGDTAQGAVPELMKIHEENISIASQCAIEDALAWIGPPAKPAIPLLLRAATNSVPKVRANALWALGEIHAEPRLCVPELIHALSDSDDLVRSSAAHALGMFGPDAKSAVPSLTELATIPGVLKSPAISGLQARFEARNALRKIDPGVVSPPSDAFSEFGNPIEDWPIFPK
jgi:HEAT repeat protein